MILTIQVTTTPYGGWKRSILPRFNRYRLEYAPFAYGGSFKWGPLYISGVGGRRP